METTPPSNINQRGNNQYGGYKNDSVGFYQDGDDHSIDIKSRIGLVKGPKLMTQIPNNIISEKESIQKLQAEMRKQIKYLDDSKWMFENNNFINPVENLPNNI